MRCFDRLKVADTPQEIPFLSILQHLLRIDPKEAISDIIWDCAETLVHRATLLENREDSTRLLRTPSVQKFTCSHCRNDISSPNRKQSIAPVTPTHPTAVQPILGIINQEQIAESISKVPKPPPPPPPMAYVHIFIFRIFNKFKKRNLFIRFIDCLLFQWQSSLEFEHFKSSSSSATTSFAK